MAVSEEIQEKVDSTMANYEVDYNNEQFQKVESDKQAALTENEHTYDSMIDNADKFYEDQKQAVKDYEAKQSQIQQENTDFAIEQIEQQKDQAHKDYLKEQSGAYVDWQKQSNQYGVEAEKMASAGLDKSGYSESSQVSMYNTYQNRVATARESYNQAVLNYNNAIKDAQLQNNAALAEIAYQSLQQCLSLSLEGFQYHNQLVQDKADRRIEIDNMYYQRYQNVLNQINTENALKENIRQHYSDQEFTAEQNALDRDLQRELKAIDQAFEKEMAKIEQDYKIAYLNAATEKEKELADYNYQIAKKELADKTAAEKEVLKYQYDLEESQKTPITTGGGSSGLSSLTSTIKNIANKVTSNISKPTTTVKKKEDTSKTIAGQAYNSIDYKSLTALGLSAVSPDKLAQLVANGTLKVTVKNGVASFSPTLLTSRLRG